MSDEYLNDVWVKFLPAKKGPDIKTKDAAGKTLWGVNAEFKDETGQSKPHAIWCFEEITPDKIGKQWLGAIKLYHGEYHGKPYVSYTFYPKKDAQPKVPGTTPETREEVRQESGAEAVRDHPLEVQRNALRRYINCIWRACKDGENRSDEVAAAIFPGVRMIAGDFTGLWQLILKDAANDEAGMPPNPDIERAEGGFTPGLDEGCPF